MMAHHKGTTSNFDATLISAITAITNPVLITIALSLTMLTVNAQTVTKMRNIRIGPTSLSTVWGTWLFGLGGGI